MQGNGSEGSRPSFDVLKTRVGSTPLRPADVLGRQLKIPNLFLKDETRNPSGSMMDRLSVVQVEDALRGGFKSIAAAAQDPRGVSLAFFAQSAGLECVVHVPEKAAERWAVEARAVGAKVVRSRGLLLEAIEASRADCATHNRYDANPGSPSFLRRIEAYASLAKEIAEGMGSSTGVLAVPTREGTAIAGLWSGFEKLKHSPKLIAATSKMGNPIVWSLATGGDDYTDLEPNDVFPSIVSEPLSTHKAHDGTDAVKAVRASGGWGYAASDEELESLAQQLERTEGMRALPASVAGIAALRFAAKFARLDANAASVAIITSRA